MDDIESIITIKLEGQPGLYTLMVEVYIIWVFSDETT